MHKSLVIIKNCTREGPGLLTDVLHEHHVPFQIIDLELEETVPHVDTISALVVLGGPDSVNDETQKINTLLTLVAESHAQGVPIFAICLGMQALVKVCGGHVMPHSVKEIGFDAPDGNPFTIELTEAGLRDPIFAGLKQTLPLFHLHGETVLPALHMTLLATGAHCHFQVVKSEPKAYGFQGHFELTEELLECWSREDHDLRLMPAEQLRSRFAAVRDDFTRTGYQLFKNFLRIAELLN